MQEFSSSLFKDLAAKKKLKTPSIVPSPVHSQQNKFSLCLSFIYSTNTVQPMHWDLYKSIEWKVYCSKNIYFHGENTNFFFKEVVFFSPFRQWASPVAQMVKCLPAVQETWVQSLGWEDPLEKEMATHSSTPAWKILWMEEPGRLQSMGSQSQTWLSNFTGSGNDFNYTKMT